MRLLRTIMTWIVWNFFLDFSHLLRINKSDEYCLSWKKVAWYGRKYFEADELQNMTDVNVIGATDVKIVDKYTKLFKSNEKTLE